MTHPDVPAEQAHVDLAYERLAAMRAAAAARLQDAFGERGGTFQAVTERDIRVRNSLSRLEQLEIGRESLVFGRIDRQRGRGAPPQRGGRRARRRSTSAGWPSPTTTRSRSSSTGGRPIAEPFYRATGAHPMGLVRRRHFLTEGQRVVDLEDELFDAEGGEHRRWASACRARRCCSPPWSGPVPAGCATSWRPSSGSRTRSSGVRCRASWSCREARAPARRRSPCTGRPTCSTPIGSPSRARACWSSARTRPSCATSSTSCRPSTRAGSSCRPSAVCSRGVRPTGREDEDTARLKGDARMARVMARAVADRQRPLRRTVRGPLRRPAAAHHPGPVGSGRSRRPSGGPGPTTPAGGPSRPCCGGHSSSRSAPDEAGFADTERRRRAAHGRGARARRCAGSPRWSPPWTGCGRSSPRSSCCTTCSGPPPLIELAAGQAPRPGRAAAAGRPRLTERRRGALDRCGHRPARRGPGPARPAAAPAGARRGADAPDVRPRGRRRGPGPVADAAADGRPAVAVGLDDRRRRHRPGDGHLGAGVVVPGRRAPAGPPGLAAGRADRQLPDAQRDHGDGRAGPRAGGAGHAGPRRGPHQRPAAPDHPGRSVGRSRSRATRSSAAHGPGRARASSTAFRPTAGRHGGGDRAADAPRPRWPPRSTPPASPSARSATGPSTSGSPCWRSRTPRAWSSTR